MGADNCGGVAQLVEQGSPKSLVAGSSPAASILSVPISLPILHFFMLLKLAATLILRNALVKLSPISKQRNTYNSLNLWES